MARSTSQGRPCQVCGGEKPGTPPGARYCLDCKDAEVQRNKVKRQKRKRAARYGISVTELDDLLSRRYCEVCGSTKQLVVDHDHDTGKVRGLLCDLCNKALGHARDDVSILARLISYLERTN